MVAVTLSILDGILQKKVPVILQFKHILIILDGSHKNGCHGSIIQDKDLQK